MKGKKFLCAAFAVLAVALGFAACEKEEESDPNKGFGDPAVITAEVANHDASAVAEQVASVSAMIGTKSYGTAEYADGKFTINLADEVPSSVLAKYPYDSRTVKEYSSDSNAMVAFVEVAAYDKSGKKVGVVEWLGIDNLDTAYATITYMYADRDFSIDISTMAGVLGACSNMRYFTYSVTFKEGWNILIRKYEDRAEFNAQQNCTKYAYSYNYYTVGASGAGKPTDYEWLIRKP